MGSPFGFLESDEMKLFGREAVLRSLVAVALTLTAPRSFAEEKTAALSTSPAPEAALPPLSSFEKTVGEIPASGILFKDVIKVMRFKDPKVSGVELFVSEYERPLTERLYDRESGTIIYVSYSERLNKQEDENKSRFKTSICAVKLDERPCAPNTKFKLI